MSDEPITAARPPGTAEPLSPSKTPAPAIPGGTRWLLNILVLLGLALVGTLVPGLLVALEHDTAALVLFALTALLGLTIGLRPLVTSGRRKVLRALALTSLLFAFVLVSALPTFFLFFRAYVMPTGSMALGLPGYHKEITCPECGHLFAINTSSQMDPQNPFPAQVTGCTCDNCLSRVHFGPEQLASPSSSGVRFVVARFLSTPQPHESRRRNIVVFRYPRQEPDNPVPKLYVDRLVGLPGETLAISSGRVYRATGLPLPPPEKPGDPAEPWLREPQRNDPKAEEWFRQGKFEIIRKPPAVILTLRRLVYDNDHPAADLKDVVPPRWAAGKGTWAADGNGFRNAAEQGQEIAWLRYRHILRPADWPVKGGPGEAGEPANDAEQRRRLQEIARRTHQPQLITDFLAYNQPALNNEPPRPYQPQNWVGDLMLECRLTVEKGTGEFWLELCKGVDRFRACFDLATGNCTLYRQGPDGKLQELAQKPTRVRSGGDHLLKFANVDQRLTLWVGDELPFGDGVVYDAPKEPGPTANDLEPASLGNKGGAVRVGQLKLWRDTYYGLRPPGSDVVAPVDWSDPKTWQPLRELPVRTFAVQPGHYFVLGDNSQQSSDSREWGLVPEQLLVGRALFVYAPWERVGPVH